MTFRVTFLLPCLSLHTARQAMLAVLVASGCKQQGTFHGSALYKAHRTFLRLGRAVTSSTLGQLQGLSDVSEHGRGALPQLGHCATGGPQEVKYSNLINYL